MHAKSGKLFDRFLPRDPKTMGDTQRAKLGWSDDERMASFSKSLADAPHLFEKTIRQVSAAIGRPVVDHIIGMWGVSFIQVIFWNESNAREPIPSL